MTFLYQIFIHLFSFSIRIASLFNKKARLFVGGRKDIFEELKKKISQLPTPNSQLIWFHCASLGEFEQARPFIEEFKVQSSKFRVLITFFSPSGYEIRKNFSGADFVFYLPMDAKRNVNEFLDIVNPSLVFFVKYDFWYNYLSELHERKIPTYLLSANFREEQFKGVYGTYLRRVLNFFTRIFVQNESSEKILNAQQIKNVVVSGDMRYDKVVQASLNPKKISLVEHFTSSHLSPNPSPASPPTHLPWERSETAKCKVVVCGSTWTKDEEIIANWKQETGEWKLIIAPHEINEEHIQKIISLFPDSLRYSVVSKEPVSTALDKLEDAKVLIIDNIGMLSNLYQYADIAYIGGGFGSGIHNILEAVAFGVPVIFGPKHHKFPEANEIIAQGGGFCISNDNDLKKTMELLLSDEKILKMASMTCRNFVGQRKGATEKILANLQILRTKTNVTIAG
ncbi:MAG: 3-deoxy-D-manno-octulosonic acid transferase [Bacteroidetes bacterium]|nr:3-deoxy-D-manno-octulosonic acid transferase [Bacteroidota bacterium]